MKLCFANPLYGYQWNTSNVQVQNTYFYFYEDINLNRHYWVSCSGPPKFQNNCPPSKSAQNLKSQMAKLKRHIESVHEKTKPFKCDICDYRASRKSHLKKHIELVHYEETKPFKCDICDYSCSYKTNLKKHIESVHEGKEAFKCDICEYICFQKSSLKSHALLHSLYKV